MAKWIIACAVVLFSTFCGYLCTKKYRKKKLFFAQMMEYNERFLNEITYFRRPLIEFVSRYTYKGEFSSLLSLFFLNLKENNTVPLLRKNDEYVFLNREEKDFVNNYFQMMGKGDVQSQKNYYSNYKQSLINMQNNAKETAKKYGDLYIKLGFLCGLFIVILII